MPNKDMPLIKHYSRIELIKYIHGKDNELGILICVIHGFFVRQLNIILIGAILEMFLGYFLFCCYKAYNGKKVKVLMGVDAVTINSLYRIKPKSISKEIIENVEISESRRKRVIRFVTKGKTYKVTVYRW